MNGPLLRVSRQYRSILRDCQSQLDSHAAGGDAKKSREQSEVLYKLELVWNLAEILFIEKTPCELVFPCCRGSAAKLVALESQKKLLYIIKLNSFTESKENRKISSIFGTTKFASRWYGPASASQLDQSTLRGLRRKSPKRFGCFIRQRRRGRGRRISRTSGNAPGLLGRDHALRASGVLQILTPIAHKVTSQVVLLHL